MIYRAFGTSSLILKHLCQLCFMLWEANNARGEGPLVQLGSHYSVKGQRNWVDELHLLCRIRGSTILPQACNQNPFCTPTKLHCIALPTSLILFCMQGVESWCVYVCSSIQKMHFWIHAHSFKHVDVLVSLISRIQSTRLGSHRAFISFESWHEYRCSFTSPQPCSHYN